MTFKSGVSVAVLLAASAPTANAQTLHNADGDEIIVRGKYLYADQVNALKTPRPIIDVPQSLSITTADQIIRQGFTSIADIVLYTPGVSNSQGEGHRDAVVFRGVRSTADFFVDGVRDDVQYYRPLYNLEQVEILRGPNALLFGRGGTGGILNRVTKKGIAGENFADYKASVNTFGEYDFQLDGNLETGDTGALRVNAFYENLNNHRDFYDGERIGIYPTFHLEPSPETLLDISYEYVDHDRFVDRGIPTGADGRPVEAFRDIVFGDPGENFTKLTAHIVRAAVQHDFSDSLKGNFSAFYGTYDKVYSNVYVSGYDQANTPDDVTLDGYIDTTERRNLILSGNFINEFATGGFNHTVIVGAEYINTDSNQGRFNSFWSTTSDDNEIFLIRRPLTLNNGVGVNADDVETSNDFLSDLNDDTRSNVEVFSAYIQDEIELNDMFSIVLGARFDSFDITVLNVPAVETRSRKDEEISPRLGLIYKPQDNVSIYGSYSESFLPRSGEQFANINGDNDALDPDIFTNLEAGVKWDLTPGLSLTAAVFEVEQSSPQVSDDAPETLEVIDSQTRGAEAQLQGRATDRWFVSVGYSYLDGEQVDRSGATGLRPRELPEHMISVWNSYQVTDRLGVGLGLTYQDESFINNSNTAILPTYTRFDASAFYDLREGLRLQINVENLTDTLYFPNSHATHQATVGAPLNARFTVTGRF
ncbi:MAG: TonB-dependent siderophore receptor [Hyphomonadaceae bacterium]|nr:TonB-dependent siderophore receptor [Hyphomonadaceae bacterium]MBC6411446.1 TonB-dependent siderophore receptor [Hyphomonadaceae bacterium]